MTRPFDITSTNDALTLDASGRAKQLFTVTNTTHRPLRGTLRVRGLDSAQANWFSVVGDTERDFPAGVGHQVEVEVTVPPGTPPAKFRMRLDSLSVSNPDDDFTEGPVIAVTNPAVKVDKKNDIPWWIWVVIGLVLVIVIGVVSWLATRKPAGPTTAGPASAPSAPSNQSEDLIPSNLRRPAPLIEFNDPRVQIGEERLPVDVCLNWGQRCGKPAADAFCQSKGEGVAANFNMAQDSPPTWVQGDGIACRDAGCDRITWLQCTKGLIPNQRFHTELYRGKSIVMPVEKLERR